MKEINQDHESLVFHPGNPNSSPGNAGDKSGVKDQNDFPSQEDAKQDEDLSRREKEAEWKRLIQTIG